MPQARDDAGNIWETDAQGNAVRLIQAAAGGQGQVFTLPDNPKEVRDEARKDEDQRLQRESAARSARNDEIANELKKMELLLKEKELGKAEGGNRLSTLRSLVNQINRVQTLFDAGPGATEGLKSVKDYLPTGTNRAFDAAGASLSAQGLAAFRVPGTGTVSDRDAIMFDRANLPQASNFDEATREQLLGLRGRVEEEFKALGLDAPKWVDSANQAQQQADNEVPDPTTGADLKPPAPGMTVASGDSRTEYNARLSAQVDAMINAGASKAMIDAVLKAKNYPGIKAADLAAAKRWMRDNPGQRYFGAQIDRQVPLNWLERRAGSETGAFLANAANAATAGLVGTAAGEKGRGALNAMREVSPKASGFGSLAGGVLGAAGLEAAIAAKAPMLLSKFAPRVGDFTYGAMTGFNEAEEGKGVEGALWGGAAGLGGGILGEKLMRGTGRVIRGSNNPVARQLRDNGVDLTVGQALGGLPKRLEDASTSIPFVGDSIIARRGEGLQQFAQAMSDEAVAPIKGVGRGFGEQNVADMLGQASSAYDDAVRGVRMPLDDEFLGRVDVARAAADLLPADLGVRYSKALENRLDPVVDAGELTGESYQQAMRGLKSYRAEANKPGFDQDYRDYLGIGMNALTDQMKRGGGEDVITGLNAADQAWKNIKVLEKAGMAARNGSRSGELQLPMPSQYNDAATAAARKFGGERPMGDLIDAGQAVLPSSIPDSGSWTRAALTGGGGLGALTGAGAIVGGGEGAQTGAGIGATGLGLTLLAAAGGSAPAQKAMVKMLVDRPELARTIGQGLVDKSALGRWTGASVLTPLAIGF